MSRPSPPDALTLWSPEAEPRSLRHYAWLLVVVPLALGVVAYSSVMVLIGLGVTAGVTATVFGLYTYILPGWVQPQTLLQRIGAHLGVVVVGSAMGCLPAVLAFSALTRNPIDLVYGNVLRITLVVTAVVVAGLVAVDRARSPIARVPVAEPSVPTSVPAEEPLRLTARSGGALHLFDPAEVTRLYASDKYTALQVEGREFLLDESLTALEERLQPLGFVRTHRGELVNRHHVRSFDKNAVVLSDGQRARVSRRLAAKARQLVRGS